MTAEQTKQFIMHDADEFFLTLSDADIYARMTLLSDHKQGIHGNRAVYGHGEEEEESRAERRGEGRAERGTHFGHSEILHTTAEQEQELRDGWTLSDYIVSAGNSALSFTMQEQEEIREAVRVIDTMQGLRELADIPWVFALTQSPFYENGLPHTRGSVIFLTRGGWSAQSLQGLLIHEKVHVYQRVKPDETEAWIRSHGYTRTNIARSEYPLIRANPDLDKSIYKDAEGNIMISAYSSDKPSRITDASSNGSHEHPFEAMAYFVSRFKKLR